MKRKIIKIDRDKCNGCGACAEACHENAIGMIDGKAVLLRDDYCDGLGDCLPTCPTGAITFEEREAAAYDEAAVLKNQKEQGKSACSCGDEPQTLACGCPGTESRSFGQSEDSCCCSDAPAPLAAPASAMASNASQLRQWPVQIKLAPVNAPYFDNANLLIAADCTAYAYGDFHNKFIKGKVTLIGCPKLDEGDYSEKLTEIIRRNNIKSVTVVRMEVPCCGGMEFAVKKALQDSGKFIPWQVVTISSEGKILD
ncbi:MAG: 4Fe-4S ferredoxin [Clostridia bacterium]|nr:4Fe-4S ferredoxin [Clostridia bacterium]